MTTDGGLPQDVAERVRSYIEHQASKGPDGIRDAVQKGHAQLMGLLAGLSDEQAEFKPAPDEWSVMDVMQHVVTAKRSVARICERLALGETPGGIGQEGQDTSAQDGIMGKKYTSLAEARAAAVEEHEQLIAFIAGLSTDANLEARFDHFLFGPLNCQEWAAFQRVHDGDHAGQIEQIKSATGFPA